METRVKGEAIKDNSILPRALNKEITSGRYPDMSVGFADDLVGRGESTPAEFSFRASGGKSINDGSARIKRLRGNSVVWNQRLHNATLDEQGVWYNQRASATYSNGEVTITANGEFSNLCQRGVFHKGHKYLVDTEIKSSNTSTIQLNFAGGYDSDIASNITENYQRFTSILTLGEISSNIFQLYAIDSTAVWSVRKCLLYDLTQMFGAGNEPTTIEGYYARKPIVADESAYSEGEVIHMTAEGIKSVGDNALNADRSLVFDFDGSYGNYDFINTEDAFVGISADGYINKEAIEYAEKIEGGFRLRSNIGGYGIGLFVKALPNEEYSVSYASDNGRIAFGFYDKGKNLISYKLGENRFTTPSNCEYIMLCLRDNEVINIDISFTDIMLTLVHSGWKQDTDAGYQPYWEDRLMFDERIKEHFPGGMKKWDMVYNKNGKGYIVKGTGVVDMGELDWSVFESGKSIFQSGGLIGKAQYPQYNFYPAELVCERYVTKKWYDGGNGDGIYQTENGIGLEQAGMLYVADTSYTDAASFKAAMAGVLLYYQLAEPTIIEYDEPFNLDYRVADFGTEQMLTEQPSAPIAADIIYQFNAVDMIRELWLKVQELEARLNG